MIDAIVAVVAATIVAAPRMRPFLGLLLAISVEQELFAGGTDNSVGRLVSMGSGWYYAHTIGHIPPLTALSALAIALCWPSMRSSRTGKIKAVLTGLVIWVLLLATLQGAPISSSLNSVQSLVAALAGLVTAWKLADDDTPSGRRRFYHFLYWLVILKAGVGGLAFVLHQGPSPDDGLRISFYDSVPLLVGAATFAVAAFDRETRPMLRNLAVLAALVLAGVSIRRASLVGAVVVLLVCLVAARRPRFRIRIVAAAAVAGLLALLVFPSVLGSAANAMSSAVDGVVGGPASDSSTRGHLRDNAVGLELARQHAIEGVGVRAAPTSDFVVRQGALLYVHNEFLYAWLHYGIIGLALVVVLVAWSALRSLRTFRYVSAAPPWAIFGAAILIGALPGYWFFPHFLTLDRFALLVGWSMGAVSVFSSKRRGNLPSHSSVASDRSQRSLSVSMGRSSLKAAGYER